MKIVKEQAQQLQKSGVGAASPSFKTLMKPTERKAASPKPPLERPAGKLADGVTAKVAKGGGDAKTTAPAPRGATAKKPLLTPPPLLKRREVVNETMTQARSSANATAQNLAQVRSQHAEVAHQRYDTRLVDLICQELKIEFGNELRTAKPSPVSAANTDVPSPYLTPPLPSAHVTPLASGAPAPAQREAEVKAASAVELIEKIETFVKSARPGLALTLDGSLGARVEIERTGPKEVALRVVGKNGPPTPEDVGRIRDEMRARGLKVSALSVG